MSLTKYKGLLFDVDGVLVNSEKIRIDFFQKRFKEKNINISKDFFNKLVGKSTLVFFNEVVDNNIVDKPFVDLLLQDYDITVKQNYPNNVEPIKETVDFITNYNGKSKIGIATVNSRVKANEVLKKLHLSKIVKFVVSRDDVVKQKPDPECYLKLVLQLGFKPSECAVIEDSVNGVIAGINAGMDSYVFLNSYNNKREFENLNIKGFVSTTDDLKKIAF